MSITLRSLLLLTLCWPALAPGYALDLYEKSTPTPSPTTTPTAKELVASQMMRKFFRNAGARYTKAIDEAKKRNKEANLNKLSYGQQDDVLMHIKGTDGMRFELPAREKLDKEWEKRFRKAATAQITQVLGKYKEEHLGQEEIKLCRKSLRMVERPLPEDHKDRKRFKDVLFLPTPLKPQDPELAFGLDTKVVEIATSTQKGYGTMIAKFGLRCFPLRIHMSEKGYERMEGTQALKNYDNNEEEGVLDPGVERLWAQLQRSTKGR